MKFTYTGDKKRPNEMTFPANIIQTQNIKKLGEKQRKTKGVEDERN